MKGGIYNLQRNEDTRLHIEYTVVPNHKPDDSISYKLLLSYWSDGDICPISLATWCECDKTGKTHKMACTFSKMFEESILPDYTWMDEIDEEVWLGNALGLISFKDRSALLKALQKMREIADIYDYTFSSEYINSTVSCGVTPKVLDNGKNGYEIRLSYSGKYDIQPFSSMSNFKFVNERTKDFAEFFTSEFYDYEYQAHVFDGDGFDRYALLALECTEKNLSYQLSKFKKTALALGCKLNLIAFSGGPEWKYPSISLCKYSVR